MSNLERGGGRRMTRQEKQGRAYNLVVASGVLGVVAVVGLVLALVTGFPWWVPILAAALAALCVTLARRTISGR